MNVDGFLIQHGDSDSESIGMLENSMHSDINERLDTINREEDPVEIKVNTKNYFNKASTKS